MIIKELNNMDTTFTSRIEKLYEEIRITIIAKVEEFGKDSNVGFKTIQLPSDRFSLENGIIIKEIGVDNVFINNGNGYSYSCITSETLSEIADYLISEHISIDERLTKLYNELEKTHKYFFYETQSGTCHIESSEDTCNISFACTPFWEDEQGIPICYLINDKIEFQYTISCEIPTDLEEFEKFKAFYEYHIDMMEAKIRENMY